ncbi:CDP-alcohol phosphatidyltransferase family protein [Phyllobacterium salinisoli]|uniref:CDP-alcohol phosphatidyltransferase family protein n=1 Tax=Phyllobacterium salinisoli TaxID=1899321 RepID=A0A368JZH7_9HYPH|nr:CDP-alcohol phosphatidyltransferase family protein [Phyllobacterium salinisoli]RCS21603.1 CDP-alcohol phosphatidyltransferase family protein [Phyllobacterium salinisoli]
MADASNRRPLASRDTGWARSITHRLAATAITPNQISMASIAAAAVAGACFWVSGLADGSPRAALLIAAAACCQIRLLCNLFDGMVAVEAGKHAPDGAFWNEFPDRMADMLILVGVGYGAGEPALGWAAAAFAVLTAYTRELGRACGLPADFSGPMAKQHRMAVVTAAALLALLAPLWNGGDEILVFALWILVIGAAATALRRAAKIVKDLRKRSS